MSQIPQAELDRRVMLFARAIYANYAISLVAVGLHIFMAFYGLIAFLETPKHLKKGRRRYIVTSFLITTLFALVALNDMQHSAEQLFKATSAAHWLRLLRQDDWGWKRRLSAAGMASVLLIGDALLVYRCFIVWQHWWVAILPGVTALTAVVLLYMVTFTGNQGVNSLASASAFLTVSTNVIVTGLLTFRLVRAHQTFSKLLASSNGSRVYFGVIAILVESAVPVALFGVVTAVLGLSFRRILERSPAAIVCSTIFEGLFYSFCALSPHMIIFRVTTGRSFTKLPSSKDASDVLDSLCFARQNTAESTFHHEQSVPDLVP